MPDELWTQLEQQPAKRRFLQGPSSAGWSGEYLAMVKQKKEVSAWLASQPSTAKLGIHYYDADKNLLLNGERLTK
jgi:hypothetical protein